MTLAILCSGQGTQHRDMFALTADAPEAAGVFAAATEALGCDPRAFVHESSDATMHANAAGQILCVTQALAGFAALTSVVESLSGRTTIAGYSIGELAAWGCAGLFTPAATIDLARQRAAMMDEAGAPGDGLAFVRGLHGQRIDALCARHACAVAIINPGETFILGGDRIELGALCDEALRQGASKAGALKVNAASHTPRLKAASARYRQALAAERPLQRPPSRIRLISGIDAAAVLNVEAGLDKLAAQISQTIDWAACLEACVEAGVDRFIELGPGRALANMTSEAYPKIPARGLEDFRGLDGVRAWLAKSQG
ncbi:ACP S-malonyltransferase [Methylocella tundrae]|uniref:ACP S-malonyltransferase n=1 Tax=Methylocella tundrae TaxID=227605 RepID=UPI0030FEE1F9|nr:acyltransferase domain-containing protein [Methylocella tundrae]